jgi:hypothetical protein
MSERNIGTVVRGVASKLSPRSRRTRNEPSETEAEQIPNPVARNLFASPQEIATGVRARLGPVPVGTQRSHTASADAVMSDPVLPRVDWNTQFEQTRAAINAVDQTAKEASADALVATKQLAIDAALDAARTRQTLNQNNRLAVEQAAATRQTLIRNDRSARTRSEATERAIRESAENTELAVDEASRRARRDARDLNRTVTAFANRAAEDNDAILDSMDQQGQFTRDTLRGIDARTREALEAQRAQTAQLNETGSRERATIINELQQQSGDLGTVTATLQRIEAQGRALPPDALEAATRAIEQEPEIQRLVNDGLLKWQDLLDANGRLDMAAVGRVRAMLQQQQVRKENEMQSTYAMFNRIETQPGRKALGKGESLWFPAMWSNTITT